ncbi:MAG: VanZ family protein [Candidatus Omnitrophica bacterium]|nr:VanZ family protein [Candidatus Omnitrophota bacterium]
MSKKERILRYWLIFFLYMASIFCLSAIPGNDFPSVKFAYADSIAHFFEYTIFGILCFRAIKISYPELYPRGIVFCVILFSVVFALSDEFHQYFVPERLFQIKDLVSDAFGSIFGMALYGKIKGDLWRR